MQSPQTDPRRIQRTFRNLSQEEIADVEQASMLSRLGWAKDVGWETLLESQRILIISEAGAGKTYECRAQQQVLWEKGEPAFYLDLSQLAANNLLDLLSRGMRPGITPCVIKPAATYAEATARFHSPAASAGA